MSNLRIGIDMDGCLADFNVPYISLIEQHSGVKLPDSSDTYPNRWNYESDAGLNSTQVSKMWAEIKASPDFWVKLPAYPETSSFLRSILDLELFQDAAVYFITNRPGLDAKGQTEVWLQRNGYNAHPTVLISGEKGLCAKALELTHYIDDKNENCTDVRDNSPETANFMIQRPWNTAQPGVPVVTSINDFLMVLCDAAKTN